MLFFDNVHLAINSLSSNKMRAFLTMLGIIIGIVAVIAIFTVGNSLVASVNEAMTKLGVNDIIVNVNARNEEESTKLVNGVDGIKFASSTSSSEMLESDMISEEMISELCNKYPDEIKAISCQHSLGMGKLFYGKKVFSVPVTGKSAGYFLISGSEVKAGSFFSKVNFDEKSRVCLISEKIAKDCFGEDINNAVGKEIKLSVDAGEFDFTVIGVFEYQSENSNGNSMISRLAESYVFMPLKTALDLDHKQNYYSEIEIIPNEGVDSEAFANVVSDFFDMYYRNNAKFKVTALSAKSMAQIFTGMLNTLTSAISIIAGIALLVGGIGVMNIMLVSVTERTREIGTRKALGAKNSSIRAQFIVEAMIICLIGGIIGIILGIYAGIQLSKLIGYPARPPVYGIFIALFFSILIGLFFGYYPANKAAKMNPIDALRYE